MAILETAFALQILTEHAGLHFVIVSSKFGFCGNTPAHCDVKQGCQGGCTINNNNGGDSNNGGGSSSVIAIDEPEGQGRNVKATSTKSAVYEHCAKPGMIAFTIDDGLMPNSNTRSANCRKRIILWPWIHGAPPRHW